MKSVNVNKAELLRKITENREKHRSTFLEALESYRIMVIKELEKSIEDAKKGRKIRTFLSLVEPMDHTRDYDRVIALLTMAVGTAIELDERDFDRYVLDNWEWKEQFLASTMSYLNKGG
jgi:hypothetical protein